MTEYLPFAIVVFLLGFAVVRSALRSVDRREPDAATRLDAVLEALRSLEFEYETGKMPEQEYRRARRRLESRALRARDAAGADPAARRDPAGEAGPADGGGLAACPGCGHPLTGDERFCPVCGARLPESGGREGGRTG